MSERSYHGADRRRMAASASVLMLHVALSRNEGKVLFNNALNTFYLRLYGIGHTDNKIGNPHKIMGNST